MNTHNTNTQPLDQRITFKKLWALALFYGLVCFGVLNSSLAIAYHSVFTTPNRYTEQLESSYKGLMNNLKLSQFHPGSVIASPSQNSPNYFFHWTRDAALVMGEVVTVYENAQSPEVKNSMERLLWQWVNYEKRIQDRLEIEHRQLGEPIFNTDGSVLNKPWGRPQNDGPALRATTMIAFARALMKNGQGFLLQSLYRSEFPAHSPIKRDLEYVANHWQESSFDLWEEVKGQHFFTHMAQRKALLEGAKLATDMQDPGAAFWYQLKAEEIDQYLKKFINHDSGYVVATLNWVGGWDTKHSGLDAATIMASVYFYVPGRSFSLESPENQALFVTSYNLEKTFIHKYPINSDRREFVPLIGRYPEDVYDGIGTSDSNPWYITTLGMAEYYCTMGQITRRPHERREWFNQGINYLDRVLEYVESDGRMSEQIHRSLGKPVGAKDLTWSYAAYVRALRACQPETFAAFWNNDPHFPQF